jgi:dihydrofolate synthase / folylpolyglutamate synthase
VRFEEAQKYLDSLGHEFLSMKLGLDAMAHLLDELGSPHKSFRKIQIAGTNGKGSTCAFVESICLASGLKAGVTTSPHLVSILERIRLTGEEISEDEFGRCIGLVRAAAERLVGKGIFRHLPTFFEHVVAAAFLAFKDAGVEVAIIETGLGGRLDATTAAEAEYFGITRIDLDHQEFLGETIAEIAAEKAAIIAEGSKVVSGVQPPDAERVLKRFADDRDALLEFQGPDSIPAGATLGLLGRHQQENAAVAVGLARILGRDGFETISESTIVAGLSNARHPGRLEFAGDLLMDGAHNISGAKVLKSFLDERGYRNRIFVFGAMKGKDIREMLAQLLDENSLVITVPVDSPRALHPSELADIAEELIGTGNAKSVDSIDGAFVEIEKIRNERGWDVGCDIICVTGSLYLVGEFKARMKDKASGGE